MIAQPLYNLLKKTANFEWNDLCQDAFNTLKKHLEESVCLHYPDFTKPFVLVSDASDSGIGFVLQQEINGILQPIQFGGRTSTNAEKRYATTDKELLGIHFACKKTEVYIRGHDFLVYTDHKPLTYLKSFKDVLNRRYRWIEYLDPKIRLWVCRNVLIRFFVP